MTKSITGTYGSQETPCNILIYDNQDGTCWYCVQGSRNVNETSEQLQDGCNVENVTDIDFFTASIKITDEGELREQVEM